jgi:hypothetical protein
MQYVSFEKYHVSLYTINAHIKVHMPSEHIEAYNYTPVFQLLHKVNKPKHGKSQFKALPKGKSWLKLIEKNLYDA